MKNSPLNIFVKALSLLLLLTTSVFASAQYTDHVAQIEMLTELVNSNHENGHRALVENVDVFSDILARRTSKANRNAEKREFTEEEADPFARRDALKEFITVSTGLQDLTFGPVVSRVPFNTVEKISPNSKNKLTLASSGVQIGNSGTYLVMYSMCGDYRHEDAPSTPTPVIAALYPTTSFPNSLPTGQGVVGWLDAETKSTGGTTLDLLKGAGVCNSFIADFSAGDSLELVVNNTHPQDSIVIFQGGINTSTTGPVFSMTVIRMY